MRAFPTISRLICQSHSAKFELIILNRFEEKLQKVGGEGPFIDHLKDMFLRFKAMEGTPRELAIMGGALLYFILPIDIIPDYIFPIGYLDDAIAIKISLDLLGKELTNST